MTSKVPVTLAIADDVATLVLDAPERRNALSQAMLEALGTRLAEALGHPGVRALVLGHTGPAFCAGADIAEQRRTGGHGVAGLAPVLRTIWDAPVPVVARIDGAVRGGGMGLVAACDLAVASETASFAFSEVRLGVAPAVVWAVCRRRLAPAALSELFLTGSPVDAAGARALGLVHRVVAAGRLDDEVQALVAQLRRGGPGALAAAKRLLHGAPEPDLGAELERMAQVSLELFRSEEAQEGLSAFLEHRSPSWAAGPGAGDGLSRGRRPP